MLLSAFLAVVLVVEAKFNRSDYNIQQMHNQLMAEREKGYEMAVRQMREGENIAAARALEMEG